MSENRRSREAVRNSVRTYGVKVMDPASLPLNKIPEAESRESVSRCSEPSLRSRGGKRTGCNKCLGRIPYATLFATSLCILGLIMFATSMERSTILANNLMNVLNRDSRVVNLLYYVFLGEVVFTGLVAVMILVIGILATGETRSRVYGDVQGRIGGRICCALLMILSMIVFAAWLATFFFMTMLSVVVYVGNNQCSHLSENVDSNNCLYLPQLSILFPDLKEGLKLCGMQDVKKFCKDYVEKVTLSYGLIDVAVVVIVFSTVLHLICLSANYARIRCQAKFQELEELRHLDGERSHKNRF